jgi:hypothetical protein
MAKLEFVVRRIGSAAESPDDEAPPSTRLGAAAVACEACNHSGAQITENEAGVYRSARCPWCDGRGVMTPRERQGWLDAMEDKTPPSGVVVKDASDAPASRKTWRPPR